jgi:hypothetical protein
MSKITFIDKIDNKVSSLPDENKLTAGDVNEIKNSVNAIYDDKGGFANYEDVNTLTNPIILPANTWVNLTNDKQGTHTQEAYKPAYVEGSLWDSGNNKIDLSDVPVGKVILVKVDFEITDTANNTLITGRFSGGGHDVVFMQAEMKHGNITHHFSGASMFYVEDVAMQSAGVSIQLNTSANSEVEVHNIMITIL